MSDLPLHGVTDTLLDPPPAAAAAQLEDASGVDEPAKRRAALQGVAAAFPSYLEAWGRLAELALDQGEPVMAYAFARVGYHRGLDAIRRAGWKGAGPVPWRHGPNQGFLRSLRALGRAAGQIGETEEEARCAGFLDQLAPDTPR